MSKFKPFGTDLQLFTFMFFLFVSSMTLAETHDVAVLNNSFSPNNLTIEVGDTVRWTNNSGFHDVTADDGSFASQTSGNFTYSRTFSSVEEILYYCSVHSSPGLNINTNMNGRINVIAATTQSDVSVESVDATDGSYKSGTDLNVKTTLSNSSAEASGAFNVNYYVSVDDSITANDTLIGSTEITNIGANDSTNLDETLMVPESLAAGDYFVGVIIDLDDTNTSNNTNHDATTIYVFTKFVMNAGLNDAWYNPITDGQGFFITIFADLGFVNLAWFTYDTELPPVDATSNLGDPGTRWFLGGGFYADDEAVLNIEFTSGGIFDTPSQVQRTDPPGADGTMILTFTDCLTGTLEYDITSINAQGTVPIQRIVFDNVPLCEALLRESQESP